MPYFRSAAGTPRDCLVPSAAVLRAALAEEPPGDEAYAEYSGKGRPGALPREGFQVEIGIATTQADKAAGSAQVSGPFKGSENTVVQVTEPASGAARSYS